MERFRYDKEGDLPASLCIVPVPLFLEQQDASLMLSPDIHIVAGPEERPTAAYLANSLRQAFDVVIVDDIAVGVKATTVILKIEPGIGLGAEGYRLEIDRQAISIVGQESPGLFYGVQTLLQLLPPAIYAGDRPEAHHWNLPCVRIEDRPRFAWRGAMLDVSRHFMPLDFIRQFIDLLAMHKMNVLHLHLTDDQGWRLEILRYPKLTAIGAFRRETLTGHLEDSKENPVFNQTPHGGYYTQAEIRALVAYAAAQHITIVPEIEMPGHAQAAIAAYPELGVTGEQVEVCTTWGIIEHIFNPYETTIEFLQNVLDEIIGLFPSQFIHVGGDEAVKTQWMSSEGVQRRIQELGLRDEDEMQAYFVQRINEFLESRGRRLIGWDEILDEKLPRNAAVMSWRGEEAGAQAASIGHDVVMAPVGHTYLDLYQVPDRSNEPIAQGGYLPLHTVYQFEPIPAGVAPGSEHHILGAQAQLWTEYMPSPSHVEYMAFPRLTAFAEVVWSDHDRRDYGDFLLRLGAHAERLEALQVNFRPIASK